MKQTTEPGEPPLLPHRCGKYCLGPLTFLTGAVGTQLSLSMGARLAERARKTFQNGVAFINRPVSVKERVCLRVERCDQHWEGALRVGFTSVQPSLMDTPASVAIPTLTDRPGYWAAPVPQTLTTLGSELQFWVDSKGTVSVMGPNGMRYKLLTGVEVKKKLWAMIDVYGQTRAVLLLGRRCHPRHNHNAFENRPTAPPAGSYPEDCSVCLSEIATEDSYRCESSIGRSTSLIHVVSPRLKTESLVKSLRIEVVGGGL
ncbi:hypothetical protein AGOR_G00011420 [Albula goreensis]|uniref:NHR domain-containing protein n=1 Tax=Albula goreensis TaxID=1534307 RepID=A0A8T3EAD4_9TELE|nr:hypothetical protein AGOR_G00011420 [Albula goreensis]